MEKPVETLSHDALNLLRQAGLERDDLGVRLSRYEFARLKEELTNGRATLLNIELNSKPNDHMDIAPPDFELDLSLIAHIPMMPVPLGRTSWESDSSHLPVIGIWVEGNSNSHSDLAILNLLTEHHKNPFGRLLFLCNTLDYIHFLGRYGFLCYFIPNVEFDKIGRFMTRRHGLSYIHQLSNGQQLYSTKESISS